MQLQLHYTNYTTPQLQLHYTTTTTAAALHHTTSSSCGRGDRPGDHCNHCSRSKKTQVQPPFSPSVDSLCHPWFTTTKLSYRFPVLKLPPLPCAVLLVDSISAAVCISGLTWFPFWKKNKTFEATKTLCQHSSGSECKGQKGKNCCSLSKPLLIAGNFWGCTWEGTPLEFLRLPLCTYGAGFLDVREAIRNMMKHVRIY